MQKELSTKRDDLVQKEARKTELQTRNSQLAKELHAAASQLAEVTTVTDPETIEFKQQQEGLRKVIDMIEHTFTKSFAPTIELLRQRLKKHQEVLDARQNTVNSIQELQKSKEELATETSLYDPEALKSRMELLDGQLIEEFDSSPWFLRPEDKMLSQDLAAIDTTSTTTNNNLRSGSVSILSPDSRSPSTATGFTPNVITKKGPMFIPPPPSALSRSQSVVVGPNGSPVLLTKKSMVVPPGKLNASTFMNRQQYFESLSSNGGVGGAGGDRSQSCYVGPVKKAPPPPPITFDKDGNPIRSPMLGKKVPPPPTSSPRSKSVMMMQQQQQYDHNGSPLSSTSSSSSPQANFYENYSDNVRSASVQLYGASTGKLPPPPLLPRTTPSSSSSDNLGHHQQQSPSSTNGMMTKPPIPPTGLPPGWDASRSQSVMVGMTSSTNGTSPFVPPPPRPKTVSKGEMLFLKSMPPPPSSRPSTDQTGRSVSCALPPPSSSSPTTISRTTNNHHVDPTTTAATNGDSGENSNNNNNNPLSAASAAATTTGSSQPQPQQQNNNNRSEPSQDEAGWKIRDFNSDTDEGDDDHDDEVQEESS